MHIDLNVFSVSQEDNFWSSYLFEHTLKLVKIQRLQHRHSYAELICSQKQSSFSFLTHSVFKNCCHVDSKVAILYVCAQCFVFVVIPPYSWGYVRSSLRWSSRSATAQAALRRCHHCQGTSTPWSNGWTRELLLQHYWGHSARWTQHVHHSATAQPWVAWSFAGWGWKGTHVTTALTKPNLALSSSPHTNWPCVANRNGKPYEMFLLLLSSFALKSSYTNVAVQMSILIVVNYISLQCKFFKCHWSIAKHFC